MHLGPVVCQNKGQILHKTGTNGGGSDVATLLNCNDVD